MCRSKYCHITWCLAGAFIVLSIAVLLVYDFESASHQGTDTMDLAKVALSMVMKWPSKEKVALGTLWADRPCVVFFMRRFG